MPSLFTIVSSLAIAPPSGVFFALIGLLTVTLNAGVRLRHLNLPLLRRWRVGRHLRDEALVQFLRGILAGHFQLDLEGGDFHEPREVASGPDGNDDVRNIHAQNL